MEISSAEPTLRSGTGSQGQGGPQGRGTDLRVLRCPAAAFWTPFNSSSSCRAPSSRLLWGYEVVGVEIENVALCIGNIGKGAFETYAEGPPFISCPCLGVTQASERRNGSFLCLASNRIKLSEDRDIYPLPLCLHRLGNQFSEVQAFSAMLSMECIASFFEKCDSFFLLIISPPHNCSQRKKPCS